MRGIQFSFFLTPYRKQEKSILLFVFYSFFVHFFILLFIYFFITKAKYSEEKEENIPSIRITTVGKNQTKRNSSIAKPVNKTPRPPSPSRNSTILPRKAPTNTVLNTKSSNKNLDLNAFLPHFQAEDLARREPTQTPEPQDDALAGGDRPIEGPSLAPTELPRIKNRYAEKDMSLFQFSQEFRQRFGAIWNAQERMIPPNSPLRPGDVVFYRVFIRSDGTMEKFQNLSKKAHPEKNYADTDNIFESVIRGVFPILVPPKFSHKNIIITEDLAIQVVDRQSPIHFSF